MVLDGCLQSRLQNRRKKALGGDGTEVAMGMLPEGGSEAVVVGLAASCTVKFAGLRYSTNAAIKGLLRGGHLG